MALPFFLQKDLAVANHAVNGRSSKSFFDEGRLDAILDVIAPGDFMIIQFGHNDEKSADPVRYTEPWTTYQDHLRLYIDGARARGARPVLATSVERRKFDASGNAVPTHGDYPAAMRALAEEERVALLDIQACRSRSGRSWGSRRRRSTSTGQRPSRTTRTSTRREPSPWPGSSPPGWCNAGCWRAGTCAASTT